MIHLLINSFDKKVIEDKFVIFQHSTRINCNSASNLPINLNPIPILRTILNLSQDRTYPLSIK